MVISNGRLSLSFMMTMMDTLRIRFCKVMITFIIVMPIRWKQKWWSLAYVTYLIKHNLFRRTNFVVLHLMCICYIVIFVVLFIRYWTWQWVNKDVKSCLKNINNTFCSFRLLQVVLLILVANSSVGLHIRHSNIHILVIFLILEI
jgi:hypothetical protein